MQKKILVAVALAVITVAALYFYSRTLEKEVSGGELEPVLVATTELQAGTRITKASLGVRKFPKQYVHPMAIPPTGADSIVDRQLGSRVNQGQPILFTDFETGRAGQGGALSPKIPKGQRALTIPVDTQGSHAGMLRPNDRVDLLGTFVRGPNDFATVTLLQKVLVLATGDTLANENTPAPSNGGPRTFSSITVAVDLEEAELLAFAVGRGPISIALRAPDDNEIIEDIPDKSFNDIFETKKRVEFTKRKLKKIEALKPQ